ncbi:hypothetical protein DIPPA_31408 [Diplonema papillatum]|nr:hypothetical protein DIPPA_31408 [Diplonema papillatum]
MADFAEDDQSWSSQRYSGGGSEEETESSQSQRSRWGSDLETLSFRVLEEGDLPLDIACRRCRFPIIERLLKAGADPFDKKSDDGGTPFFEACETGHLEIVERIIPGINPADFYLKTRCENWHAKLVQLLLTNAGAKVDLRDSSGATPLISVCSRGLVEVAKVLINANAEVDAADKCGKTGLMHACDLDKPSVVRILIEAKAQLNLRDDKGETALAKACRADRASIVQQLLKAKGDVNVRDKQGRTALFGASAVGIVKALIKAKVNVNARDNAGDTALSAASSDGNLAVVQELVGAGADVNLQGSGGRTALMRACGKRHKKCAEGLMKATADAKVNIRDKRVRTALFDASAVGIVKELLKAKVNVNARDNAGDTALSAASSNGYLSVVQELIDAGADVNLQGSGGRTALARAREKRHARCVETLLQAMAGPKVNIRDKRVGVVKGLAKAKETVNARNNAGDTTLSDASACGYLAAVQELIDAGADVNLQGSGGRTALMRACEKRHGNCVEALLKAKADVELKNDKGQTALYCALATFQVEVCNALLEAKAKTDVQANDGTTLLCLAARGRMHDMLTRLLLSRSSRKYVNCSCRGGTILMDVCMWGDTGDVQTLLDAGADVNAAAGGGTTALRVAISYSRKAVFALLVEAGANVDARDSSGETALHEVSEYGRREYILLLLAAGARIGVRSDAGDTPLMLAVKRGQTGAATLLLQAGARGRAALAIALLRDDVEMRELLEAAAAETGPFANGVNKALRMKRAASRKEEDDADDDYMTAIAWVAAHNAFRCYHHSDDLVWNDTLQDAIAGDLNDTCTELLPPQEDVGQSSHTSSAPTPSETIAAAWYNTRESCSEDASDASAACLPFTQLVWRFTRSVGCAACYNVSTRLHVVVCQYYPAGNVRGYFNASVSPRSDTCATAPPGPSSEGVSFALGFVLLCALVVVLCGLAICVSLTRGRTSSVESAAAVAPAAPALTGIVPDVVEMSECSEHKAEPPDNPDGEADAPEQQPLSFPPQEFESRGG